MITTIYARGFKGQDFSCDFGQRTLLLGPNGSGKSARSMALQLLVLGYAPGAGAGRQNKAILDAFGNSEPLRCGVILDARRSLERILSSSSSGVVSQSFKVDGQTCKADKFNAALGAADIRVLDLGEFMALSDAKKIAEIFRLFPPAGDLASLDQQIEEGTRKKNALVEKRRRLEALAKESRISRNQMQLPAGTLPELRQRILNMEAERDEARAGLQEAEAQAKSALEQARQEESAIERQPSAPAFTGQAERGVAGSAETPPAPAGEMEVLPVLDKIQEAMARSGCQACAASLILKKLRRELSARRAA